MAHYKYDRLSAQDNDFLAWEHENLPMHGGSTQIFSAGPLAREDGGIDFPAVRRGIEGILHRIPRYREKLAWIPGTEHAVWVDDPAFNLDYHLRHTALPRPGSDEQLKQLAARITERPLDRSRPLWEIWIVEGLSDGRFATIGKTHHCMVDGAGGMDLAKNLFSTTPDYEETEPALYVPRPRPRAGELRRDEWLRLAGLPIQLVEGLVGFARGSDDLSADLVDRVRALGRMAWWKAVPASDTPLNGPPGLHRRVDWLDLPLGEIKEIRKALGCSVNDVVLGIVNNAIREFLMHRQVDPSNLVFRVATPVNVRRAEEAHSGGNRVSTWIVPLPLHESDQRAQVAAIHETTEELKRSHQASAIEMVEAMHEWIPIDLQSLSQGVQNLYVTNVPGPQLPLYLMGAELQEIYLHPPLLENLGLAIGVLSYNGRVCWGITADYDRIPDVDHLADLVRASYRGLAAAAGVRLAAEQASGGRRDAPATLPGRPGTAPIPGTSDA